MVLEGGFGRCCHGFVEYAVTKNAVAAAKRGDNRQAFRLSVAGRGDARPAFRFSIVGRGCLDDHVVAIEYVVAVAGVRRREQSRLDRKAF